MVPEEAWHLPPDVVSKNIVETVAICHILGLVVTICVAGHKITMHYESNLGVRATMGEWKPTCNVVLHFQRHAWHLFLASSNNFSGTRSSHSLATMAMRHQTNKQKWEQGTADCGFLNVQGRSATQFAADH